MQKYEEGLTDDQLDKKISDAGGELQPKEKPANPNLQNVIMDGYIFEIDRSVPKIVDYIGPANGLVITASISQSGWPNPTATVTGEIKTFSSGERITSSSANVTSGSADVSGFPTAGGAYTISGITTDTTIVITVTDSKGETKTKEIPVVIKRDTTGPNITANVTSEGLKITINATATDDESGLQSLTYSISPTTGLSSTTGPLTSGTPTEITTTAEKTYTVTITATDNAGNTSTKVANPVTTTDGITVAEAKATINASNIKDYIGKKITDYNPTARGTWRVFYYDATGYFGDGAGTLYLKRDFDTTKKTNLLSYTRSGMTENGLTMMKKLNPAWKAYGSNASKNKSDTFLDNEKAVAGLCDTSNWENYKVEGIAKYAIGSPSVEMYMRAFNLWKTGNENANNLVCKVEAANGYSVGANGNYDNNSGYSTANNTIEAGPNNIFMTGGLYYSTMWLASPSSHAYLNILYAFGGGARVDYTNYDSDNGFCPVVSLNH